MKEQHVRAAGGDVFDLRNRLSVLHACHMGHHTGSAWQKIAQSQLRPENVEFARELLGDGAQDYLDRHYPKEPVPRVLRSLADETPAI